MHGRCMVDILVRIAEKSMVSNIIEYRPHICGPRYVNEILSTWNFESKWSFSHSSFESFFQIVVQTNPFPQNKKKKKEKKKEKNKKKNHNFIILFKFTLKMRCGFRIVMKLHLRT